MRNRILTAAVLATAVAGVCVVPGLHAQKAGEPSKQARPEGPVPASAPADAQAQVPVKQVVLFSSGVGYFEHFGTVQGNGSTELQFKTQQINDILKSLVLQDLDGGQVSTVTYPSQDPVAKTLRSFQVDITGNPSLAELLNQLRGARVTVSTATAQELTGIILGVERKPRPLGDKDDQQVVEVSVLNILTGSSIRSVMLDELRDIELEDPQLRAELEKALAALAQARGQDKKPVTINFRGEGERRVRVGYVVETPIWKTSYRLILGASGDGQAGAGEGDAGEGENGNPPETGRAGPDAAQPPDNAPDGDAAARQQPLPGDGQLQGWAIVENQTDSDWTDVQLSLVSGRPISFIQDLYQPLYIARPIVQPELYASLRPQTYDAGMERGSEVTEMRLEERLGGIRRDTAEKKELAGAKPGATAARARRGVALGRGGQGLVAGDMDAGGAEMEDEPAGPMDAAASVASIASAAKVGELFQYTVGSVTLPRQKSAMIPIVTDPVQIERLSIYNQTVLAKNPLNGARVRNTTGKHLLQGPVTVLDDGAYAGDARIDDVPPGQERLLSYGIDQQVLVDATKNRQESAIQTGRIVKGVLEVTRKNVFSQDYLAENKGEKDKTLLIEHPLRRGWKLVAPAKADETTESLYRFKGKLPAGKTSKLTVREEVVQTQEIVILPTDLGTLEFYGRTGEIPEEVRVALREAIARRQALAETERQVQLRQQKINEVSQEQNRIRENMKTVAQNSEYYQRLLKKLDEQETTIEKLQSEAADLQKTAEKQRRELEEYLAGLNVAGA